MQAPRPWPVLSRPQPARAFLRLALGGLLALGLAACRGGGGDAGAETLFPMEVGGKAIRAELAVTQAEQRRGMMGRTELGEHDGILFVYPAPRRLSFWMRDTPLPLDIGFFMPDGTLAEVRPLEPMREESVASRSDRVQFALEMNRGWFERSGVRPGARLDLAALEAALEARGFEAADYGLADPAR